MSCWSMSQEVCASCRYWNGCREISSGGLFVEVEPGEQGKCVCPDGGFRYAMMNDGAGCMDWEPVV